MENNVNSLKKNARLAGLWYLIWVITGIYGTIYIPSQIFVKGDIAATANNMLSHEFLFRVGIVNDLFGSIIGVFLILALYRLLKQVNECRAILMVMLLIITGPVVFITEAFNITSLMILKGDILKTFELNQKQDIAMLFLKINDYGVLSLEMFWGLWLIPFGQLVYKSGFIPRILGIFLLLNGVAYIIHCLTALLFPNHQAFITQFTMPFWILGEISITLWL
ncbi:MAG TPA: DUF4386 domain-containing protein, partial [Nitrosopumilaceae archaeon]|nr:DUF4386 domain-containing protein [Nitrosopumilaceae archaeon]